MKLLVSVVKLTQGFSVANGHEKDQLFSSISINTWRRSLCIGQFAATLHPLEVSKLLQFESSLSPNDARKAEFKEHSQCYDLSFLGCAKLLPK